MDSLALSDEFLSELVAIRQDLHANPEIGFEERRTSAIVATLLGSWGVEVHRGIGGTGVVGVLRGRLGAGQMVGLRADMDALPMQEQTALPYRSRTDGRFHGCGHDGHTAILLGAARYLSETRNFSGTVIFIFQPAEEGLGGARAMLKDGLFDRFPCRRIYGFHNWPDLALGQIAVVPDACMAGADFFDITLRGKGGHGAMPQHARDPITAAAQLITALQTVVSRGLDPLDAGVLSVTRIHAGDAYNVIPASVHMAGTLRYFSDTVHERVVAELHRIVEGCAATFDIAAELKRVSIFSVTRNDPAAREEVIKAASEIVGLGGIATHIRPTTGSEDFAEMLAVVPGAYFLIGHGGDKALHHPEFFFDDNAIPIGARILARLVEQRPVIPTLSPAQQHDDPHSVEGSMK